MAVLSPVLRLALASALLWFIPRPMLADGLMVSTGTIVLSDRHRAGSVGIAVPGPVPSAVEVDVTAFVQDESGRLREVPPSESAHAAASFIRYGPRRFSATPGRATDVRLAARPPADLPPGEYRMHLRVLNRGAQGSQPSDDTLDRPEGGFSVRIPIQTARGVRVLYRHGITPEPGELRNMQAELDGDGGWRLRFDVLRRGEASLIARYQPFLRASDGEAITPWEDRRFSIYVEQVHRQIERVLPGAGLGLPTDATLCVRLVHTDPGAAGETEAERCAE